MRNTIRAWLARYDAWCERMGLIPENRRCCAPIRYDEDDARHPAQRAARLKACQTQNETASQAQTQSQTHTEGTGDFHATD
ncbi:hypothetical protein [Photobacterium galatheae]|uniref:Uncharacterized protein n=1 Tax=Photobacterium galatheae TaxID=1654360 RepID=A0A066RWS6_9GAMM|nr:hypothetical protein [Photobacterium galatheae]KDM91843.1 hypothetical protein EA58_08915 [Photobacterium galatheae]MCM0147746.1 hypothetical protein [Photobacterium galatheae]